MAYGGTSAGTSGTYSQADVQGKSRINAINGQRGIRMCGYPYVDTIDYFTIQVTGNAIDFGENTITTSDHMSASDGIRFINTAGSGPGASGGATSGNDMTYKQFMSSANAVDWGDLVQALRHSDNLSGGARALTIAGYTGSVVDYTIQKFNTGTIGSASNYYNGLRTENMYDLASGSDGSRGVMFGGEGPETDTIDYISIYIESDAVDFGEMLLEGRMGGTMHGARGWRNGGDVNDSTYNGIEMFEIGTRGNAVDYGELTQARYYAIGTSDGIRNVTHSGGTGSNVIEYYQSYVFSNALDFGDLTSSQGRCGAAAGG